MVSEDKNSNWKSKNLIVKITKDSSNTICNQIGETKTYGKTRHRAKFGNTRGEHQIKIGNHR